jgi:threonine dehydrogenase-like Zn-dependent dehydrogenase
MWAFELKEPSRFETVEVPPPDPGSLGPGQVLLRTVAGGICGSDLPYFKSRTRTFPGSTNAAEASGVGAPLHEIVGRVVATKDPGVRVGALVVGWASSANALAEFVVSSGEGLFEYDPQFSPSAAVMMQPLACVLYAAERMGEIAGSHAAVIGQGPIGVLFSHVLKSMGAATVTGIDPVDRDDVAAAFLIDKAVRARSNEWVASLDGEASRPNIVVETVGHQGSTLRDAVYALARGGHLYYFGIPDSDNYAFPMLTFLRKDARMTSGVTRQRRMWLARANSYLRESSELPRTYITHEFPMSQAQRAFELAIAPAAGQLKVILNVNQ